VEPTAGDPFRLAFDRAPAALALIGEGGRFLEVNPALCALLGRARGALLVATLGELAHEEDRRAVEDAAGAALADGAVPGRREARFLRSDGRTVWALLTTVGLEARGGAPCAVAVLEDLGERRDIEERLRQSEARFRTLIERSHDLIVLVDPEGHNVFTTPSGTAMLGWSAEELRTTDFRDMVHPDDAETARGCFEAMWRDPATPARAVLRFKCKQGGYRSLDSLSRNFFADPSVNAIVVNARDVTDERRLQVQLAEAQKLESVGRLAGGVAHDFNNLLSVILSCVEFIEDAQREGLRPSPDDLSEIRRAGERARDLTRQLLAVARRQVIAPRPVDVNEVVRDAERLFRRVLGEDVALRVALAPRLEPVLADATQLQQVLLNLVAIARDAMPTGGSVTLETEHVELDARYAEGHAGVAPGPHVLLAVTDSGSGLTPEVKAHLFEPFFTTKPLGKGTGLGLATVYGIVKQLGGHVWAYSEAGMGTTFKCYFPVAPEGTRAAAPAPAPPVPSPGSGTERILLVEDDPSVRALAARALEGAGYEVLVATGPRHALELARAAVGTIALLLTDVVMPEMNGRRLAEEIARTAAQARVLYVSGYTQNVIVHHGVLDGGLHFLAKPFTPTALLAKVREVLDAG
jgi:PAS domain S-box-containing protein